MADPYDTIPKFIDSEEESNIRVVMDGGGNLQVATIDPKYVINNGKIFMEEGVFEFKYTNLKE